MNKYKMITICSLSIVCILILSLLLPLTTSANDKESMELDLHYEKSSVTVRISVNSQIYTGVVCKYIEVDNILEYDDLSYQTKENGKTLNLNKQENDNYITTIENVSKRYIVVYASIGNCSLCDYIDCQKSSDKQSTEQTETPKKDEGEDTKQPEQPAQSENNTTTQPEQPAQSENNTTTQPEQPAQSENNTTTQPEQPAQSENNTKNKKDSATTTKKQTKQKESSKNSTETAKVVDKDSINTDDFEEIKSIDTTKTASTSDSNMPQTGENDTAKFVGIIVFSIIGIISFYKYKESCKAENM